MSISHFQGFTISQFVKYQTGLNFPFAVVCGISWKMHGFQIDALLVHLGGIRVNLCNSGENRENVKANHIIP